MKPLSPPDTITNGDNTAPGTGADWMGPRQPMRPIAQDVAGRTWDYVPGYNLTTQPRAFEEINFDQLRALAAAYDPVRLIIERRKDQLCRVPWVIRQKNHDGAKRAEPSPQMRGLIKDTEQFFRNPTADLTFRPWIRSLLDDLLVLDAPALYCTRDGHGNLVELLPIDGATVKLIIGDDGRQPQPFRWDGTPFTWLGQTVTPDNLDELGFRITGGFVYPPVAQRIFKGLPAANLGTWDLVYAPLNRRTNHGYGASPVQMICTTISTAMRRSVSQLTYFTEGNQVDAFYALPESWTPDKVMQFQDYYDNLFSGNLANRRRMKFMPGGSKDSYFATREPPLKTDFDEWMIRIVCFAFSYPPSAFVSLSNRSIAESHEKQAEEEGVEPLKNWFLDLANRVIDREFSEDIEFAWSETEEVDQERQSNILNSYAENGILTINQVREKLGEEPDPNPAANQLMVKTATGYVPIGGEVKPKET